MSQSKRARPNGPTVLPSVPGIPLINLYSLFRAEHAELFLKCHPTVVLFLFDRSRRSMGPRETEQARQVAYQRNRLARWAEKCSA